LPLAEFQSKQPESKLAYAMERESHNEPWSTSRFDAEMGMSSYRMRDSSQKQQHQCFHLQQKKADRQGSGYLTEMSMTKAQLCSKCHHKLQSTRQLYKKSLVDQYKNKHTQPALQTLKRLQDNFNHEIDSCRKFI